MIKPKTLYYRNVTYSPKWFDQKCLDHKKKPQLCLTKLRKADKNNNVECKNSYLTARTIYKNLCNAKKLRFMCTLDQKLSNIRNAKDFYGALSFYSPKYSNYESSEHVNPDSFKNFYS